MKLFTLLRKKKRAISPVISVILLIGLAVAASALIFLVVIPILTPKPDLEMQDAYLEYDDEYTTAADEGVGYGKGTVSLYNSGTADSEVTSIKMYNSTSVSGPWTEIINAVSLQDITTSNTREINPVNQDELTIRFPIPEGNYDNSMLYKIVVDTKEGRTLDSSSDIEETTLQLAKDRPDISFTGTLNYVRRTQTISPTSVSDNSAIKNVTYEVSTDSAFSTIIQSKTITSSLWSWQWNTFNDTTEGLDNDSYYLRMTVYDYAGLSASTYPGTPIQIKIDNDYTPPTIGGLWLTDPYPNNQTAEVGQSVSFTVEIVDTGTEQAGASITDSAYLYYRINGSVDTYDAIAMNKFGTTNNWTTNIPSSFVDSTALENGIECYVSSDDFDGNIADTSTNLKILPVDDHVKPDISHTTITTANWDDTFINISAIITDKDQVNESKVKLYYRQTDDYGGKNTSWVSLSPSVSGNGYSWLIWSTDISIHGLDYFFNATDRFSGQVANDGTVTFPNHINIPDTLSPMIDHTEFTSATEDVDLTVVCRIFDEDPTFGADPGSTGTVTLHYRDNDAGGGTVLSTTMNRISGNSSVDSNSETPEWTTWSGTIPASLIVDDGNPSQLDYYIRAIDESTNLVQNGNPFHYVPVITQGDPNIEVVPDSITAGGTSGEQLYVEILNKAGSTTSAKITKLNLTILSSTTDFSSDYPMLNDIQFNTTQVWSDSSPSNTNKTWVTFTLDNYTIAEGGAAGITMTFENSTAQPYPMYDLDIILELFVYNKDETGSTKKVTFQTPPAEITVIERLYMTSTYQLSTTGTTSQTVASTPRHNQDGPTLQIGIRVFVGGTEITNPTQNPVALATVTSEDVYTETQGNWNCPQTTLNPTDSVTVSVRALIGSTEYTLASFSTGALGATELSAAQWQINYWVRYRYQFRLFGSDRYWIDFGFGDLNSYDSFVDNFIYVTQV